MIEITRNEEEFYRLPKIGNVRYTDHTYQNLMYKAMTYAENEFWASDLREILLERFGIEVNASQAGKGLRSLWEKKYVTRETVGSAYFYNKTAKYHDAVRMWKNDRRRE